MTLTEQWKKGELKDGEEYWVILTDEWYSRNHVKPVRAFYSCECEFEGYLDDDIKEVLAPVPSYEEWKAQQDYEGYLKKCISVYEKKEKQHTDDAIAYNELKKEYDKQKSILKECFEALLSYANFDGNYELYNKIQEMNNDN